ncbi:MAG: hypothetical protein IKD18_04000 [Clostridia bacterium]|nr:hypothetical protein [Clostridia bacterium]
MKKRILAFCLCLICLVSLGSCGKEEEKGGKQSAFTPLFRFMVAEGRGRETRLISLPDSDGFFYLHPNPDGAFTGGFVSPKRSVAAEGFVTLENADFCAVSETERDRATLVSPDGITHLLLKEGGAETKPFGDTKADFSQGLFFDDFTLLGAADHLLVLCPVDLSQTYVLADTTRLPDFAAPLAVTHTKTRIWYARGAAGDYTGIAFFEYGKNVPLGSENFPFHAFQPIGNNAVLFTRNLPDGGAMYLYRNLETDDVATLTVDKPFHAVTCDPAGTTLCGTLAGSDHGSVEIYDLKSGKKRGTYSSGAGVPADSLAISPDGKTLLFSMSMGGDAVLATLDLTQY